MNAAAGDAPVLARALLGPALAALRAIPADARGPALDALDRFLAAPGPATFLGAARVLGEERRLALLEKESAPVLRRARADGLAALAAVPGFPTALVAPLAHLPTGARTGRRLHALAALARAYDEWASRVAADTDEMRRSFREGAARKSTPRR